MNEEIAKVYDPAAVEQKWYKIWEENGYFKPVASSQGPGSGKTFTIVIPPPNVTGSLHMGHALNNSIQDLLIRYKRMNGFETLWVPGTDHAGIATQNVVERELKKEGKTKDDLGREKFIAKVWQWKKEYGGRITQQLRRLGASCDWSRERFTMDEGLNRAVKRHFVQLYNEGLIYRGKRIINWCPRCGTAISDIEVGYETVKGHLWHIRYPIKSEVRNPKSENIVVVATTRPETMLGDTAVAVNPKDERYRHMWGKTVELPLVGRHIPIIKDEFVDPAFGTGAVKVTPAHDPNDYELGQRHNLPLINVMTPDGKITFGESEAKVEGLAGLDRLKAREEIVRRLEEQGLLVKIEDHETSVGHCYRCRTVIEPYLSDQWFVKVGPLAEKANRAVEEGRIKFVPERWTKLYMQWMTNTRDWCISRQLWWGHQIPAYYCRSEIRNLPAGRQDPKSEQCSEIIVSEEKPEKCPKCGGTDLEQDPDVFDTWFSSALWPFSTLGWPDQTADLKKYYPTDVLVTSYDIIFFWVARMIMAGLHFTGQVPFHTVYFNALVKDIHGKKMSKSWGNVIDPLEVINKAGADALRFAFLSLIAGQGQDVKLSEDKITEARNFANKIWNASRFVLMGAEAANVEEAFRPPFDGDLKVAATGLELADHWILSRLNHTIDNVTKRIEEYDFGLAARALYDFIWGDYCDWYLELAKSRLYGQDQAAKKTAQTVLLHVLEKTLKLLHPFMPFITEEIYSRLPGGRPTIMLESWPEFDKDRIGQGNELEYLKAVIISIRNIKAEMGVATKEVEAVFISGRSAERDILKKNESYLKALARTSKITVVDKLKDKPEQSATGVAFDTQIYIPLKGLIDISKEIERLKKEEDNVRQALERLKNLMNNQEFRSKAPPETIAKQEVQQKELAEKLVKLSERAKELM